MPGSRHAPSGGPCLVVLIGVAGSGKSTLARRAWDDGQVLSLDALRGAVSGDPCDQDATADAVTILHLLVHARLRRRLTTVVDATSVQAHARRPLLEIARSCAVPAVAVVVATPLPACVARNGTRPGPAPGERWGRQVPEAVIREQHAQLRRSLRSLRTEGFTQVITYDGATRPQQAGGTGREAHRPEMSVARAMIRPAAAPESRATAKENIP